MNHSHGWKGVVEDCGELTVNFNTFDTVGGDDETALCVPVVCILKLHKATVMKLHSTQLSIIYL